MIASSHRPTSSGPTSATISSPAETSQVPLEVLYERHAAGLVRWITTQTRDPDLAADVVQEAFLRLAREVGAGRVPDSPPAWLAQVARNLAISNARRAQTASRFGPLLAERGAGDDPVVEVLARERAAALRIALADLCPVECEVLVLAAHGLSRAEIATRIGRSEGATRSLLHRARRRLRPSIACLAPVVAEAS